jgi:hypothetical protein
MDRRPVSEAWPVEPAFLGSWADPIVKYMPSSAGESFQSAGARRALELPMLRQTLKSVEQRAALAADETAGG